jgi:predicted chitinase
MVPSSIDDWLKVMRAVAPRGKDWILLGMADNMPIMIERFKINTVNRQAHFLGQCGHESDGFQTTEEYASGAAYENRKDLGNTKPGDGKRFKGRGVIQLTGRYNYEKASMSLGEDYLATPEVVAKFPHAALVSGWFWDHNSLHAHADRNDHRAVTKTINGGYTHLDRRIAATEAARKVLIA